MVHVPDQVDEAFLLLARQRLVGAEEVRDQDTAEALEEFERASRLNDSPTIMAFLGQVYAASGERDEAQRVIEAMQKQRQESFASAYDVALIYAGLSENDLAFEWLEKACADRDDGLTGFLASDPRIDSLRGDRRFDELMNRVGFEDLIIDSRDSKRKIILADRG